MPSTPFHAYYQARKLENHQDALLQAFASSNIEIYPYQIAAAGFVLRSNYLRGCLLSDESSLGKTYEALLVATQKWVMGKTRQMLILPVNMIDQWVKKIENSFTIPYILIDSTENWNTAESDNYENPFIQEALVISTYDFAAQKAEYIQSTTWDLIIFDEADSLNDAYNEDKKIARTLKNATDNTGAFKLLLTASPIEMDIRDIYGLLYFIDETILPFTVDEFYQYFFRHPERYPELAAWVSKFSFRTLKSQVTEYAKFTNRIPYTLNCEMTKDSRRRRCELENLINKDEYIQKRMTELSDAQHEEIERMKLQTTKEKSALEHAIGDLRTQVKSLEQAAENAKNRAEQMDAKKKLKLLYREHMEREERLFFDSNRLDVELEKRIEEFLNKAGLICDLQRQFVLAIKTGGK